MSELRALVIDSIEDDLMNAVLGLCAAGMIVQGDGCGKVARMTWLDWNPHLVVIDQDIDGGPAWRVIRDMSGRPEICRPLIVAVTCEVSRRHKALCQEHGADEYIFKTLIEPDFWCVLAERTKEHAAAARL